MSRQTNAMFLVFTQYTTLGWIYGIWTNITVNAEHIGID